MISIDDLADAAKGGSSSGICQDYGHVLQKNNTKDLCAPPKKDKKLPPIIFSSDDI